MVKGVKAMALWSNSFPASGTLDGYISRMASGDTQGLELLYQAVSPGVYAFALSVLKNSHDAEDVLQDTFLRVYNGAAAYRSQGKPMAWILTIAKNLCYKRLQEQQRTGTAPQEWQNYTQSNISADDKAVIWACMEQLSDDERQIVVLHAVAGFKHREIAQMLDEKLSTVLSKYHRAIKKLKENF
ncbi:MAG: RNA polymerase sigma factor [Ruminococcaceae bacterium]|nr:RNA polymerase sigma factor [Oscillospiraceae bacterium]